MSFITNYTYDELKIGEQATLVRTITEEDIQLFAKVSGDINPAHFDANYAASTRFKKVIAHGMLTGAFISAVLGSVLPGPGTIYISQNLQFLLPVYIGDVLTISLTVQEKLEKNRVQFTCKCTNQDNQIVTLGQSVVLAPKEKLKIQAPQLPHITIAKKSG